MKIGKLWTVLGLVTCVGCGATTNQTAADTTKRVANSTLTERDANHKTKPDTSQVTTLADLPPSQADERERLSKTYDDIKITDSVFLIDNDTLHFHMKYYCLKNINLTIPKGYDENEKNQKDFVTHPFVADILVTKGNDTILSKEFRASDFYSSFIDPFGGNLKKYGSIIDPRLSKQNKDKNYIDVRCSISIPTTDLGLGLSLIIDKKGGYKIQGPIQN